MSRRSTLKRRRERKRRKHQEQKRLALQLPPNRPSTAKLIELIQLQASVISSLLAESESK